MSKRGRFSELVDVANASKFFQLLDMEIQDSEPGKSRVRVMVGDKHLNSFGTVHGGVYCTALDAAIFFACFSKLASDQKMTSLELKVNFLAPSGAGEFVAEGTLVHQGKRVLVGEGRVVDALGRLLANGVGTCLVLPRSKPIEEPTL